MERVEILESNLKGISNPFNVPMSAKLSRRMAERDLNPQRWEYENRNIREPRKFRTIEVI